MPPPPSLGVAPHSKPGLGEAGGGVRPGPWPGPKQVVPSVSFGGLDIREKGKKDRTKGGSSKDSVTSKEGPEGRLPGTRRLSVGEVRTQREMLSSWVARARITSVGGT